MCTPSENRQTDWTNNHRLLKMGMYKITQFDLGKSLYTVYKIYTEN